MDGADHNSSERSDSNSVPFQLHQSNIFSSINRRSDNRRSWKDVIDTVDFLVDRVVLDEKREAQRRVDGNHDYRRDVTLIPGCSHWDIDDPNDKEHDTTTASTTSASSTINDDNNGGGKCPICLNTPMNDPSHTDTCTHRFCFVCIKEWCKVRSLCPLCKQRFRIVYHNLDEKAGSKEEWKIPLQESNSDRRFSYRDTLTGERLLVFEHISRLQSEIQNSIQNRTLSVYQSSLEDPVHHRTAGEQRRYLASELSRYVQLFRESATMPRHAFLSSSNFRRFIYERGLHVRPLEEVSNPENRAVRECNHEFFSRNEPLAHRLVPFITLDLHVLCNNDPRRAQRVIARVIGMLARFDITSQAFRDRLRDHLRNRADHFCHELYHFARSPHSGLEAYFTHAVYHQDDDELQAVLQREDAPGPDIELISETVRNPPAFPRNRMRGHNNGGSIENQQSFVINPMVVHQYHRPKIDRPTSELEGAPSFTRSYQRLHDLINCHRRPLQAQLPIERFNTIYQQISHDRERQQQQQEQQHQQSSARSNSDHHISVITNSNTPSNSNTVQSQDIDVVGDDNNNGDDDAVEVVVDGTVFSNNLNEDRGSNHRIQVVRERWDDFEAMRRLLDPAFVDAMNENESGAAEIDLTNDESVSSSASSDLLRQRRQPQYQRVAVGEEEDEDGEVNVFGRDSDLPHGRPHQHTGQTVIPASDGSQRTLGFEELSASQTSRDQQNPTSTSIKRRRRKPRQSSQYKPVIDVLGVGDDEESAAVSQHLRAAGPMGALSSFDVASDSRERTQPNRPHHHHHAMMTRNGAAAAAAAIRDKHRRKRLLGGYDDDEGNNDDGQNESSRRKSRRIQQKKLQHRQAQNKHVGRSAPSSDYFSLRCPEYEDIDNDNSSIISVVNQDSTRWPSTAAGAVKVIQSRYSSFRRDIGTSSFLNRWARIRRQARRLAEIRRQTYQSAVNDEDTQVQTADRSDCAPADNNNCNETVLGPSSPFPSSDGGDSGSSSEQRRQPGRKQYRSGSSSSTKRRSGSSKTKKTNNDGSRTPEKKAQLSSPELELVRESTQQRRRKQWQRNLDRIQNAPICPDIIETGEAAEDSAPTVRDRMLNGYAGYWQTPATVNSNQQHTTEPTTSKDTTNWEDMSSAGSDLEVVCEMKPKRLRTPPLVDLLDNDEPVKQQQSERHGVNDDKSTSAVPSKASVMIESSAAADTSDPSDSRTISDNEQQQQKVKTDGSHDCLVIMDDDKSDDDNNDEKITPDNSSKTYDRS